MKAKWNSLLLCCGLFGALLMTAGAKSVPFSELPATAQSTVKTYAGKATIGDIDQSEEDGVVTYDVSFSRDDDEFSMTVAANGALLELEIQLNQAPAAVQSAVAALLGKGELDTISQSFEDGAVTYEIDYTNADGLDRSASLNPDGSVFSLQVSLEQTPEAVQKTIAEHKGQNKVGDIFRTVDDGKTFYEVDMELENGKERQFVIATNGRLERSQVFPRELTQQARETVKARLEGGRILWIDKVFHAEGPWTYEVNGLKDGKPYDFKVGQHGKFLGLLD